MAAYYNEFKPEAAHMLRQLIKDGLIADGEVDERSITEVKADELKGFTQCHFFAGIGGWSVALRQAGWGDERPVWTGSCPCQPFSAGGDLKAQADERHLRPIWSKLIIQRKPPKIYGEQVAKAISFGWLDEYHDELEPENYSIGSAVLPATSIGLSHERERLFFVCNLNCSDASGECKPNREDMGIAEWQTAQTLEEGRRRFFELVSGNDVERVNSYDEAKRILDGLQHRSSIQHGFGNAIVPEVATRFIRATK